MIHSIESCKDINSHGKIDGFLYGILMVQEYVTVLGYVYMIFYVKVNISKVDLVICFI